MEKRQSWAPMILGVIGLVAVLLVAGWYISRTNPRQVANENTTTTTTPPATKDTPKMNDAVETVDYRSTKGVVLKLDQPIEGTLITNPVTLTGQVPGNWSFEASFPVELRDAAGKTLAKEPATLQGDWMTDQYVPFTVTLTFVEPEERQTGTLIFHKDNPSGLASNDDQVTLKVQLGTTK